MSVLLHVYEVFLLSMRKMQIDIGGSIFIQIFVPMLQRHHWVCYVINKVTNFIHILSDPGQQDCPRAENILE